MFIYIPHFENPQKHVAMGSQNLSRHSNPTGGHYNKFRYDVRAHMKTS